MSNYVVRYRPKIAENNDTLNAMYESEGDEVENLRLSTKEIIDNLFIRTSDIIGVQRWEKFFNIKPNSQHTVEERKAIVLNKVLYRPPFTRQRLTEILQNIWGKGNYVYQLNPDDYRLIIDINTNNPTIYLQFSKQLRNVVPANIYLILSIQYTHMYLGRNYTYRAMSELTYEELSRYSVIDEE